MARGVRAYARSRGVSRGTVAAAIAAGTIPLLPSGDIDTARADADWLPYWRPMTGPIPTLRRRTRTPRPGRTRHCGGDDSTPACRRAKRRSWWPTGSGSSSRRPQAGASTPWVVNGKFPQFGPVTNAHETGRRVDAGLRLRPAYGVPRPVAGPVSAARRDGPRGVSPLLMGDYR